MMTWTDVTKATRGRRLLMGAGALLVGLLLCSLPACLRSQQPNDNLGGETNWLSTCTDGTACGGGLSCLCGVCTEPCGDDACAEAGTSCLQTDALRALGCEASAMASTSGVCIAQCDADADCRGIDAALSCVSGRCERVRSSATPCGERSLSECERDDRCVHAMGRPLDTEQMCLQESAAIGCIDAGRDCDTAEGILEAADGARYLVGTTSSACHPKDYSLTSEPTDVVDGWGACEAGACAAADCIPGNHCCDQCGEAVCVPDGEFCPLPDCGGYSPCADKACGDRCTICAPDDPACSEIAALKVCDPLGQCVVDDGSLQCRDAYEPCADKVCGDACTVCPPDDPACTETAELKLCDAGGTCRSAALVSCLFYDPCAGKVCGASCSVCDPADTGCIETAVVKACDPTGSCRADGLFSCDVGGTFACGPDLRCGATGQYCYEVQPGVPDIEPTYSCEPFDGKTCAELDGVYSDGGPAGAGCYVTLALP